MEGDDPLDLTITVNVSDSPSCTIVPRQNKKILALVPFVYSNLLTRFNPWIWQHHSLNKFAKVLGVMKFGWLPQEEMIVLM